MFVPTSIDALFLTSSATCQNVFIMHFINLFHVNIIEWPHEGQMCVAKAVVALSSDGANLTLLTPRNTASLRPGKFTRKLLC